MTSAGAVIRVSAPEVVCNSAIASMSPIRAFARAVSRFLSLEELLSVTVDKFSRAIAISASNTIIEMVAIRAKPLLWRELSLVLIKMDNG